jgi:hypothetical protein
MRRILQEPGSAAKFIGNGREDDLDNLIFSGPPLAVVALDKGVRAQCSHLQRGRTVLLHTLPYTGPDRLLNIAETSLLLRQRQRGQIRCLHTTHSLLSCPWASARCGRLPGLELAAFAFPASIPIASEARPEGTQRHLGPMPQMRRLFRPPLRHLRPGHRGLRLPRLRPQG